MLKSTRLTLITLDQTRQSSTPYLSLTTRAVNRLAKTYHTAWKMWHWTPAEPRPAAMVHMLFVTFSSWAPELPFKRRTSSLRREITERWEVDSLCPPLYLTNNKPYFLCLETLLLLFINCKLALRSEGWLSGNMRNTISPKDGITCIKKKSCSFF
jgi:hypothetical protein